VVTLLHAPTVADWIARLVTQNIAIVPIAGYMKMLNQSISASAAVDVVINIRPLPRQNRGKGFLYPYYEISFL